MKLQISPNAQGVRLILLLRGVGRVVSLKPPFVAQLLQILSGESPTLSVYTAYVSSFVEFMPL